MRSAAPRDQAASDRLVNRWYLRMRNVMVDQSTAEHYCIAKVATISGVNELGVWFDNLAGSTFLRRWAAVRADLLPALPPVFNPVARHIDEVLERA